MAATAPAGLNANTDGSVGQLEELALLREAARLSGTGAWSYLPEMQQLVWSAQMFALHEVDPQNFKPTLAAMLGFIGEESRHQLAAAIDTALAEGGSWDLELSIATARGHRRWVRTRGECLLRDGAPQLFGTTEDITVVRQARDALRTRSAETRKLALVAENTSDLVIITDAEHRIEWVNDSFARTTGYRLNEAIGRTPLQLLGLESKPGSEHGNCAELEQACAALARGEAVMGMQLELRKRNGTRYLAELDARPVWGENGAMTHVLLIQRDITKRREAEKSLQDLAGRLQLATDSAGIGTFLHDLQSGQGFWDAEAFRVFGFAPAPWPPILSAVEQRIHPEDRARFQHDWQAVISNHAPQDAEYRLLHGDERITHIFLRSRLQRDPLSGTERVVGVVMDVTARHATQQQVSAASEWLALAGSATGIGFFTLNLDGSSPVWDAQLHAIFGLPPDAEALPPEGLASLVLEEDRAHYLDSWQRLRAYGAPPEVEFRIRRKTDGSVRWIRSRRIVQSRSTESTSGLRQMPRVFGAAIDVTDIRTAQDQQQLLADRLTIAIETAGMATWECDLLTGAARWDDALYDLYGMPRSKEIPPHESVRQIIHPEDRELVDTARQRMYDSTETVEVEFRVQHSDGTLVYLNTRGRCQRDAQGKAVRLVGTTINVTASREAQRRLREFDEWMSLAASAAGVGFFKQDESGRDYFYDRQTLRIFGFHGEGQQGKAPHPPTPSDLLDIVVPEDLAAVLATRKRSFEQDEPIEAEHRVRLPSGELRHILTRRKLQRDEAGRPRYVVGAVIDVTEQRRAQSEREQLLYRLQLATQTARIGIWEHQLTGHPSAQQGEGSERPELWDTRMRELYGVPASWQPSRKHWLERVHPDDRADVARRFQLFLAGGGGAQEYRIVRPDGSIRIVADRLMVQRNAGGLLHRLIGTQWDITDMRAAERERDTLAHRMSIISASVGIGIWDWDPVSNSSVWNDRMFELFGHTRESFANRSWYDMLHPDDVRQAQQALSDALSGNSQFEVEFRVIWPDGSVHWIASHGRAQRDSTGRLQRMIGFNLDVTERRNAEAATRDLLERMSLTTAATGIGLWELDVRSGEVEWDAQMYQLYGRTPMELNDLKTQWPELIHPEDTARVRDEWQRSLRERQPLDIEHRIQLPDSSVRYLAHRAQLQLDSNGQPKRQLGVTFDVTERQLAENALRAQETAERANLAKTEFLSRMSHELRTPLNAILGFTQILSLDPQHPLATPQRERVEHIQQAGWHLLNLINEMMDLSRIEAGKANLQMAMVPLADTLRECIALISADADKRRIATRLTISRQTPQYVWADPTRLKQVLLNLLSNAVKYNREGGKLRMSTSTDAAGNVIVAVRDTGHGMSAAQLDKLFEPYNRLGLDAAPIEGSGIGLAISLKLVELMGGKLDVSSEPGVGSVFRLTLQVATAQNPSDEASADAPQVRADIRGSVLYVEDNPANVAVVEQIFTLRPNVKLFTAPDGASGRVLAAVCQPDLILLDMRLPDIDGFALFRELRAQKETRAIPCAAISANALPSDISRARKLGFIAYWTKPVDAAQMLEGIDAVLGRDR